MGGSQGCEGAAPGSRPADFSLELISVCEWPPMVLGLGLRVVGFFFQPSGYSSPLLKAILGTEGLGPDVRVFLQQSTRAAYLSADPARCFGIDSA